MHKGRTTALLVGIIILGTSVGISLFADTDPTVPTATAVATSTMQDTAVTITLAGVSNDSGSITFATTTSPAHGTLGTLSGTDILYTPETGYTGTDSFQFVAIEGATSSTPVSATITVTAPAPTTGTAHITVRDGAIIATSSSVSFPLSGTVSLTATSGGSHDVAASSALAVLSALDTSSSEFDISDLAYYPAFGSFLINCITVPAATSAPVCYQWQYSVNGSAPTVGMDQYALHDGDSVYVYFGAPNRVVLSTTTIALGESITATAQSYDPATDTYNPDTGAVLGEFAGPNYAPTTIFATSTVGSTASAVFTPAATGTYAVAIVDAYGSFTGSDAVSFTVTDATSSSSSGGSGGFSGGTNPYAQTSFSIPNAVAYLATKQNTDGSFASDIVTDWSALALANYPGTARDKLKSYLTSHVPALTSVTDYERHAMALMALGINPFNGTSKDVVTPIRNAFDGTQVGDSSLVTDDIFALFPLLHSGSVQFDPTIRAIAAHIIATQKPNGSWENSADVTAAAMQALGPLYTTPGYGMSLGMGAGYLASTEQSDGGWNSIDSTSWVMTMVNSVKEGDPTRAPVFASTSGKTPADSLNTAQQSDGGVASSGDRTWSTAYAIVAASGKSWISLMQEFTGPSSPGAFSGGTDPYATSAATSTATSTAVVATSTEPEATSTAPTASSTPEVTATTTSTSASQKPASKPLAKKIIRATPRPSAVPAPEPATPTASQTAAAADAQPSFFGRIATWLKHLFGW